MKRHTALLAAAAGALFLASPALAHDEPAGKVKCEGVNGCKGQTDCHSAKNECHGQNGCKGKGWKSMTAEQCEAAKKAAEKE